MSQTSYSVTPGRAVAGMLADSGQDMFHLSRAAEGAAVPFGLAVVAGTNKETQVKIPTATEGFFMGVSLHEHTLDAPETGVIAIKETLSVCRKGRIWVKTNEVVAAGEAVFFVNSGADAGKFRNDNTSADAAPAGVAFAGYDAGTGLALLELNLP